MFVVFDAGKKVEIYNYRQTSSGFVTRHDSDTGMEFYGAIIVGKLFANVC